MDRAAVEIGFAESREDVEAVRALCRDFVAWQFGAYPEQRETLAAYFQPDRYELTLQDLPRIHARPEGGMLLARQAGRPVGCIMYLAAPRPGAAEVKRLFVQPEARGAGLGAALIEETLRRARQDGYREIWLDTGIFLKDALRLYAAQGFERVDDFVREMPEGARSVLVSLRRDL